MRQKTATCVIAAVAGAVALTAIGLGLGRACWWHGPQDRGHHERPGDHHGEAGPEGHAHGDALQPSGLLLDGARVIQVAARKFEFVPGRIVVRAGEPVRLEVTSEDVTHGFGLSAFEINRTLEPHQTETITFTPASPGRHGFHCTHYCGQGHADMTGELIVLESTEWPGACGARRGEGQVAGPLAGRGCDRWHGRPASLPVRNAGPARRGPCSQPSRDRGLVRSPSYALNSKADLLADHQ